MQDFRILQPADFPAVKELFRAVFTGAPWHDDWSDEAQLDAYLRDLTGNANSLGIGLFENGALTAASLGSTAARNITSTNFSYRPTGRAAGAVRRC